MQQRVVVLGAGITGLTAARAVQETLPSVEVVVLEATDQVGGKLRLGEVAGATVDLGAESILNRRPEGVELIHDVGLADRLVHPATVQARVWSGGHLRVLPPSMMGVPHDIGALSSSKILSTAGLARAALDQVLPATDIGDTDVSAGWLVEERFGPEVVDRLLEPLLGGVYAGQARELSARATLPGVVALLCRGHSLGRSIAASVAERAGPDPTAAAPAKEPVFAGLIGGVGGLPRQVAEELTVRTGTAARGLERHDTQQASGWRVQLGPQRQGGAAGVVEADAVIVALPAAPAARVLAGACPAASAELARIEYASTAVISLAFAAHDFPHVEGSGFLVPAVERRLIKAATYSFAKWDWVRQADPGLAIIRASMGRHREEQSLQRTDSELVEAAVADLQDAIGLSVRPLDAVVTRWGGGLPQYAVGHLDRVRRIRAAVAALPGVAVCGAAYDGVGIPACVASGRAAAELVAAHLRAVGQTLVAGETMAL